MVYNICMPKKYTEEEFITNFWNKVDRSKGEDSCWPWQGYIHPDGYGQVRYHGKMQKAHRIAYLLTIGNIPDDMELDHLCKSRDCINPNHLEPVTRETNINRSDSLAVKNRQKTHCPKGHPYSEENTILDKSSGGRRCQICRREQAKYRKRWRLASFHGTPKGILNNHAKITEDDVKYIRDSSLPYRELAKMFHMSINSIYWIHNRITWKHVI